ncbi:hypothetical protein PPSIR1_29543 [Plesiocystis pacifica SIR-1]|uniref:Uncharacterized protein n=1 Tax=Plesiocystis pacifica SIR-1 TaxID=391625 RepID=A6G676_9BACT|nr:hypothetical protein [Plesiocystis pacifica]EDM78678.1 hypothetical protein PPSIR1_29543 [Plesiocystis pacifica SIR-1]
MSDAFVLIRPHRPVWIGCNVDGDPDLPRVIEVLEPSSGTESAVIHERPASNSVHAYDSVGVNEAGLALVYQRAPTRYTSLVSGADDRGRRTLLRDVLARSTQAEEALELIVERYSSQERSSLSEGACILIADGESAWLLELAGELWAAVRIRGRRVISGALTIQNDFDRIHPRALQDARREGWTRSGLDFGFARCFAAPRQVLVEGSQLRRANTLHRLLGAGERADAADLARVLRDHAGGEPDARFRPPMTCSHPSLLPNAPGVPFAWRQQTTMSLIAALPSPDQRTFGEDEDIDLDLNLGPRRPSRVWMTGTPAPCLSVFKPVAFESQDWSDHSETLWRLHQRFHMAVLRGWRRRSTLGGPDRAVLERRAFMRAQEDEGLQLWAEHRRALLVWLEEAERLDRERPRLLAKILDR